MSHIFASKSAKILIAEEGATLRQLLSDTLRGLGFKDITVFASARDVFGALEREHCDWIIAPTFLRQPVNTFHILKTICEVSKLQHIRVSLFADKDDEQYLKIAFQYGLLSWHPKVYFAESVQSEFSSLFDHLEKNQWSSAMVAEEYLRKHMYQMKMFEELIEVQRNLMGAFPGSTSLLLKYGETQMRAGRVAEGIATLKQACLVDQRAVKYVEAIKKSQSSLSTMLASTKPSSQNNLGIKNCVLVDPDTAVLSSLKGMLNDVGVSNVATFEDGQAAWEWLLTNPEPDLIIHEWRLKGIAGPLLLQRIRQHGFVNVPISILSSVIKLEESHLLRELGVSDVIAKPFAQQTFFKSLIWTLQQHVLPTEQNFLHNKIRRLLASGNVSEANRLKKIFLTDPRIQTAAKRGLEAEFAFAIGEYQMAMSFAVEALRVSGDSLWLLNLIGKCALKLGDNVAAMQIFEKAHALSPLNLEHLCNLAICQHDTGKKEECEAALTKAKSIDGGSFLVKQTECQLSILQGLTEQAKKLMDELPSLQKIIAYMNNRAVALIRSGRFNDGIKLYEQTIASIPSKNQEMIDRVEYNLSLAFARYGELERAEEYLEKITQRQASFVHNKSLSLLERIKEAKVRGEQISFFEASKIDKGLENKSDDKSTEHKKQEPNTEWAGIGRLCLYGIFQNKQEPSLKYLDNSPQFKDRSDLNESMHLDH